MLTTAYEDEETGRSYFAHHYGDFSGDVIVSGLHIDDITLPMGLLTRVVAEMVSSRQISELEQMSDLQILGVL